ncbi:Cupin superfamily protein [Aureococcus anophagefferens]|uniref:Cupin superfamily protein n=1 Tax=Aureococcus anophagefferens TaxID=44056 RepID=A0ABR1GAQ4_AURAN
MGTTFAAVLRLACIRAALALAPICYEWNAATDGVAAAARRAQFAADIWRKAPLLIRGALDAEALDRACDVDLLAGLALEDDVVSRLVTAPAFAVEVGPFDAAALGSALRTAAGRCSSTTRTGARRTTPGVDAGAGDLLYVPPRLPHDGVALGDGVSSTFSFGLRTYAPRPSRGAGPTRRWRRDDEVGVLADPAWDPADGATVPAAALATAKDAVRAAVDARLADGDGFAAWFGAGHGARGDAPATQRPLPADWDDALAASLGGDIVALDDADALAHAAGARAARARTRKRRSSARTVLPEARPGARLLVGRLASTPAIDLADIRADLDASRARVVAARRRGGPPPARTTRG